MMKTIDNLGDDIVGIEAHGKITGDDYERVLIPNAERALRAHGKLRFLYQIAPDFDGFSASALFDDARFGVRHLTAFERVAIVTDVPWIVDAVRIFRPLMPSVIRIFSNTEIEAAKAWIQGTTN